MPCTCRSARSRTCAASRVTNVFGERVLDRAGRRGRRRGLAALEHVHLRRAGRPGAERRHGLLLLPTAPKVQRGRPARGGRADPRRDGEHGVGRRADGPARRAASGKRGVEAARETLAFLRSGCSPARRRPPAPPPAAPIRYQVMTSVPENWIPFRPRARRGRHPRDPAAARRDAADPGRRSEPTRARAAADEPAAQGLDATPPEPYFVHEEEVPRAGLRVEQGYRRTRWRDGRVVVWFGARRGVGRGEGSSGLAFDRLADSSASSSS